MMLFGKPLKPVRPQRFWPFAAWAGLATMGQKYPLGQPKNGIPGNAPRLFHHEGHARGVLYWWNRGDRRAKGPQITPDELLSRLMPGPIIEKRTAGYMAAMYGGRPGATLVIDESVLFDIEARIRAYYMKPPEPKKNCLFVKHENGEHTIVAGAKSAEWVYP